MKSTKNENKLIINKETIASLNTEELSVSKGGRTWTDCVPVGPKCDFDISQFICA